MSEEPSATSGDPAAATVDLSTAGYTPLSYPGPAFRPIPSFTFDAPPGWLVAEFADALCLVGTPDSFDGPWSNVFLQHERVIPSTALEEVAVESWDATLFEFPDAITIEERIFEFEQYHYVRECELVLGEELVTRVDSFWFGPDISHPMVDLFHLIGIHPVEAGTERTIEYLKMLSSFRFADPGDDGADDAPPLQVVRAPRRRSRVLIAAPESEG